MEVLKSEKEKDIYSISFLKWRVRNIICWYLVSDMPFKFPSLNLLLISIDIEINRYNSIYIY